MANKKVNQTEVETTVGAPQKSTPNRDKLAAIYEAYKKQSPTQYEFYKDEYARNLAKSEADIGRIIS